MDSEPSCVSSSCSGALDSMAADPEFIQDILNCFLVNASCQLFKKVFTSHLADLIRELLHVALSEQLWVCLGGMLWVCLGGMLWVCLGGMLWVSLGGMLWVYVGGMSLCPSICFKLSFLNRH